MKQETGFLTNHADAIAIVGVNITIFTILIAMFISNSSRIDSMNSRIDASNARMDTLHVMFYDLLKEVKK